MSAQLKDIILLEFIFVWFITAVLIFKKVSRLHFVDSVTAASDYTADEIYIKKNILILL